MRQGGRSTYDQLNQLTQVIYPDNHTVDYTYDEVGNRLNQISSTGDNPTVIVGTTSLQYDYEDRLTLYQDSEKTIHYTYDGDGNLIKKTITSSENTEYEYLYDYSAGLPRLLVENKNGTDINSYIYAGRLYSRQGPEGTVYYHQDGLGSTLTITDSAGQILNKYTYDAYGEATTIQENVYNSILFTGEMQDQSGLIYLRARYYDPAMGSFLTKDTLFGELNNPLTQNLYAYCFNNPVNYTDPSGHERCGGQAVDDRVFEDIDPTIFGFGSVTIEELGVVYLRTSPNGGQYVGQSKNIYTYKVRQWAHRYFNKVDYEFEMIGRAKAGKDLDILEQTKINEYGGAKSCGGTLENKINKINVRDWEKLNIPSIKGKDDDSNNNGGGGSGGNNIDESGYWESDLKPGIYPDDSGRFYSVDIDGHMRLIDQNTSILVPGINLINPPAGVNIQIPQIRIPIPAW